MGGSPIKEAYMSPKKWLHTLQYRTAQKHVNLTLIPSKLSPNVFRTGVAVLEELRKHAQLAR